MSKILNINLPLIINNQKFAVNCRKVLSCTRLVMYMLEISCVLHELLVSSNMALRAGSHLSSENHFLSLTVSTNLKVPWCWQEAP